MLSFSTVRSCNNIRTDRMWHFVSIESLSFYLFCFFVVGVVKTIQPSTRFHPPLWHSVYCECLQGLSFNVLFHFSTANRILVFQASCVKTESIDLVELQAAKSEKRPEIFQKFMKFNENTYARHFCVHCLCTTILIQTCRMASR